jgi:hypothetical protein
VMGYELDGWGSIPGRGKIFLCSTVSKPAQGPTQPPIQWVLRVFFFTGVKRLGRETVHSPPSSAKDRNSGAIPSLPHASSWRGA